MLKLAGGVLIMAASLLAGMSAAEHVQDEYEAMRHIRGVLYALRSEILYSRSCLGEAFGKIAGEVGAPFDQWLSGMAEQMQERDGIPFSVIWKNGMSVISAGSRLPGKEKERLEMLGMELGSIDMEAQIRSLDLYLEELRLSMEEKREGMKTRIRLCRCLGLMGGLFLSILLI